MSETLQEIHNGISKAYPCGAGLGLMGVSTDGDVALCHRFAGSDEHKLRHGARRRDRGDKQQQFLDTHHVVEQDRLPDLLGAADLRRRLLSRSAHALRRSTNRPNLHYCDWIRGWTHTCLEIYGELAERNPGFLRQFDDEDVPEKVS